MIPRCQPIKITVQNVALNMPHTRKSPQSISIKRQSHSRQVESQSRSVIETFDFNIIPNHQGYRGSQPQSQLDYRRSKKVSSYMVYKEKQK